MKQIFDWLREQINREKVSEYDKEDASFNLGLSNAISKVYRAEAKWEADCCVRVVGKPFTSTCGQKYDKWTYIGEPYCANCGKPIKISEVE